MYKNSILLKVIVEPVSNSRNVLIINLPETRFFIGNGFTNYLCGKCNRLLADSIDDNSLNNLVLKCNKCQCYNEILTLKLAKKI